MRLAPASLADKPPMAQKLPEPTSNGTMQTYVITSMVEAATLTSSPTTVDFPSRTRRENRKGQAASCLP